MWRLQWMRRPTKPQLSSDAVTGPAVADGPSPAEFTAVTWYQYVAPPTVEVSLYVVVVPPTEATLIHGPDELVLRYTLYELIALLPVLDGAAHESRTPEGAGTALKPIGDPGTLAELTLSEALPSIVPTDADRKPL